MPKLLPFRIHFEDPEVVPLDLVASDAEAARQLAPPWRPRGRHPHGYQAEY